MPSTPTSSTPIAWAGATHHRVRHRRGPGRLVKRLALFHHDPTPRRRDDGSHGGRRPGPGRRVGQRAGRVRRARGPRGSRHRERAHGAGGRDLGAAPSPDRGARVLVVTPDESQVATIEEAEDGMVALPVPDMHAALTRGTQHLPDVAIVDTGLPPGDGADLIPAFRSRMGRANFPVILLADRPRPPRCSAARRPTIWPSPTARRCGARARARVAGPHARGLCLNMFRDGLTHESAVTIEDMRRRGPRRQPDPAGQHAGRGAALPESHGGPAQQAGLAGHRAGLSGRPRGADAPG